MKTILKLSLLVAVLLLIATCQREEEGTVTDDLQLKKAGGDELSIEGKYIVVFKDQVANPHSEAENLKAVHGLKLGHVYEHCLRGFSATIPPAAIEGLMRNPNIDYIEPDKIISISEHTIPTGIRRIAVNTSTFADIDGDGGNMNVDVAVIDTGVDTDHPDLNVVGGVRYYLSMFTDSKYDDDHGHGSHVAGTIGARDNDYGVVGVAPGARIWAVKVLNSRGSGYQSDIIKGIDWVKARAADIEVINMSIGGTGYSSSYRTAIANCVNAGIVVMVAAGNEASDVYGSDGTFGTGDDRVPAAFPEAAAISALADSDGQPGGGGPDTNYGPDDSFATFSNFSRNVVAGNPVDSPGMAIDLLMPGVNIYSCYKDGGYATMSGTSMASPHAAGLAALYIAEKGRATNAAGVYAIRQILIDKGKFQTDPEGLATQNDPDDNEEKLGWVVINTPQPNQPPVANFTFTSSGMTANFTDTSTDTDGTVSAWLWNFGDGTTSSDQNPSRTYTAAGTYAVSLTVTDDDGATSGTSKNVTVTAPAGITLTAVGNKVKNVKKADLTWDPTGTGNVDIYRNNTIIATTAHDGSFTDVITLKGGGTFVYKVCIAGGTITCSNEATVVF